MPSLVVIGPLVQQQRIFKIFVNVFLLFPYNIPFEKDMALHLNNLDSPSPTDALCQV